MIDKINQVLPNHVLTKTTSENIYVVDYKDLNRGDVTLFETQPTNIKWVHLHNIRNISIVFDGFKENALPIEAGLYNRQCECVLFPESCNETDWILFIEAKYADNFEKAFDENADYPNCMINQIIETVRYFREKEIIPERKRVNAIVSFPNLIEAFNSYFCLDQIEDILLNHRILLRATNSALIKSEKRITLNSI